MSVTRTFDDSIEFSGRFSSDDFLRLRLDAFDRLLLDECGKSDRAHDWLLGLEMLFRRRAEMTAAAEAAAGAAPGVEKPAGTTG